MTPNKEILQRGLWWEEFEPGTRYVHRPGRTVTETDEVLFSTLTMNTQPLHLDAHWASQQTSAGSPGQGQRVVNSLWTLSTVVGLSVSQLTQGTIVANLGFSEVSFPFPLFHGDTLYAETVCLSTRLSASRPGQGIVQLEHRGRNQHGQIVCRATRATLVLRAPGAQQAEATQNMDSQTALSQSRKGT